MSGITLPRHIVEEALERADIYAGSAIREGYSGRFMYGDTCFGVVCAQYEVEPFLGALREAITGERICQTTCEDCDCDCYCRDHEGDCDCDCDREGEVGGGSAEDRRLANAVLSRKSTDNMGLDMIVYFPGVTLGD